MSREYWENVGRLSNASAAANVRLVEFLGRVPQPKAENELAEYDALFLATATALGEWMQYCKKNRNLR